MGRSAQQVLGGPEEGPCGLLRRHQRGPGRAREAATSSGFGRCSRPPGARPSRSTVPLLGQDEPLEAGGAIAGRRWVGVQTIERALPGGRYRGAASAIEYVRNDPARHPTGIDASWCQLSPRECDLVANESREGGARELVPTHTPGVRQAYHDLREAMGWGSTASLGTPRNQEGSGSHRVDELEQA
jgi:hypothetical protein